jgi:hypothetical protein
MILASSPRIISMWRSDTPSNDNSADTSTGLCPSRMNDMISVCVPASWTRGSALIHSMICRADPKKVHGVAPATETEFFGLLDNGGLEPKPVEPVAEYRAGDAGADEHATTVHPSASTCD